MKNKTFIGLSLFLISAAALALFAGCSGEMDAEEFLENKGATNQIVTYYANGGTFDGTGNVVVKDIHYPEDSYVIGDFDNVQNISVSKEDNVFNGWYFAELGADSQPLTDDDGNVIISDRPVDFTVKIKQGEHWYICADWIPNLKVIVKLVTDDDGDMHDADGNAYAPDEEINYIPFENGNAIIELKYAPKVSTDYSFTQYFKDKECTDEVRGNIPMPEGDDAEDRVIYAKYIKGNWNMVREIADVRRMFNGLSSGNWYFCNMMENKVLDCSSMGAVALKSDDFGARVEGNGFTLKNVSYTVRNTSLFAGSTYSVFGQFNDGAIMRNLTFDGLSVNVTNAKQDITIYLISAGLYKTSAPENVTLENVTFKNVQLTISSSEQINNIGKEGDEYNAQNWLFGGVGGTDEAFLEIFSGVTVENGKLTMISGGVTKEYPYPNA